jgi:hypothetical protein
VRADGDHVRVYLKDPTGAVRRLTATPEDQGVRDAVWFADRVVTVGRELPDRLAVRDVNTPPTSRGSLLERQIARNPAVSRSGVLAYTRLWRIVAAAYMTRSSASARASGSGVLARRCQI